jgi:hypothetical protein
MNATAMQEVDTNRTEDLDLIAYGEIGDPQVEKQIGRLAERIGAAKDVFTVIECAVQILEAAYPNSKSFGRPADIADGVTALRAMGCRITRMGPNRYIAQPPGSNQIPHGEGSEARKLPAIAARIQEGLRSRSWR